MRKALTLALAVLVCGTAIASDYSDLMKSKSRETATGFLTIHKIEDKIYFEVPKAVFGKRIMMGVAVEKTSNPLESCPGFQPSEPEEVFFDTADSSVVLCTPNRNGLAGDGKIASALRLSSIPSIISSMKIKCWNEDSTAVVFDATPLLDKAGKNNNPLSPTAHNAAEGYIVRTGTYQSATQYFTGISAFGDHVSVSSSMTYKVKAAFLGVFASKEEDLVTAEVKYNFILLPGKMMETRPADRRLGYAMVSRTVYDASQKGADKQWSTCRWRLDAPVVFHVDDNLPEIAKRSIRRCIGEWNKALKSAGAGEPLSCISYSESDSLFNEANLKYSCVRFVVSPDTKISDTKWFDPRTGEILSASIFINQGVVDGLRKALLLQTSAADTSARTLQPSEELLEDALTSRLLKNFGHCLGLRSNLIGSDAYSSAQIKDAAFTKANGIAASVMDELPFNFIADEEDFGNGTAMMQLTPGSSDIFTLRCLYDPSVSTDEAKVRKLIEESYPDPALRFRAKQPDGSFFDPRTETMDLGSDVLASTKAGIDNLKKTASRISGWIGENDPDYTFRDALSQDLLNQMYEYVRKPFEYVGGIFINDRREGDPVPTFQSVPKELQRDCLKWIVKEIQDLSWMDVQTEKALDGKISAFACLYFGNFMFIQLNNMYLSESKSADPYTQEEAAEDLIRLIWGDAAKGRAIPEGTKVQQKLMVANFTSWANAGAGALNEAKVPFSTTPDRSGLWYKLLKETRVMVKKSMRAAKDESERARYAYYLHDIDKTLNKEQ